MSDLTIPDAFANDLRDLFAENQPISPELPETALRVKFATGEPPSPRLSFLTGDPRRIPGQDATARVPFTVELAQSLDRVPPADHMATAGKIDEWLREIRIEKRRAVIHSRVYLHDLYVMHPVFVFGEDGREQIARMRGEAIVTLAVTE